jgi:prepilin-type N-terminal cleavage/methylation domain-containing protein
MSKRKQKGVTLIEIVVSLMLVGGLVVLFATTINISLMTKRLRNENLAYHIASAQIESMRAMFLDSLPPSGSFSDPNLGQLPSGAANFTVTNHGTYTGVKEIIVTVNWNDGKARSISVRTLAGEGGINR